MKIPTSGKLMDALNETAKIAMSNSSRSREFLEAIRQTDQKGRYYEIALAVFAGEESKEHSQFKNRISSTVALRGLDGELHYHPDSEKLYKFRLHDFTAKNYNGIQVSPIEKSGDLVQLASNMGVCDNYLDQQVIKGYAMVVQLVDEVNGEYGVAKIQSLSDKEIRLENHHGVDGREPSRKMQEAAQLMVSTLGHDIKNNHEKKLKNQKQVGMMPDFY